jgi:FRG domain
MLSNMNPEAITAGDLEAITLGTLATVSELIDLNDELVGSRTNWAFRGQPRDYGSLTPSFQRQFERQSVGTAELIERRLIETFRRHYENLKDRNADMPLPGQIGIGYDLRCLSVMQHYEIPTRLLDWTSHFWTAVYFACASDPAAPAELWYYDRNSFTGQRLADVLIASLVDQSPSPAQEPRLLHGYPGFPIVELDPGITPRMKDQRAHHTVSPFVFADHAKLLHDQQTGGDAVGLRRVLIDGSCKSKALQHLAENEDITPGTIFPDVVGLGRFLRWQFESLRTMLL